MSSLFGNPQMSMAPWATPPLLPDTSPQMSPTPWAPKPDEMINRLQENAKPSFDTQKLADALKGMGGNHKNPYDGLAQPVARLNGQDMYQQYLNAFNASQAKG